MWCIPPTADAEFVARMEDILDVYQLPYDPLCPVVCMDESCRQWLAEMRVTLSEVYPGARCVRLVQDHLNMHTIASLYEVFPPEEARSMARRLEILYPPKHGTWLNMAETELSILERQCLDRRLDAAAVVRAEVGRWEATGTTRKPPFIGDSPLDRIQLREITPEQAVTSGEMQIEGKREAFGEFVGLLDSFPFWFNIVTP